MRPRFETGPFKFEVGDIVVHASRIRGEIVDMGWSDELKKLGIKECLGRRVKVCLIRCRRGDTVWVSEALLRRIPPLQALAEVAK
jgi:hypothetical protein